MPYPLQFPGRAGSGYTGFDTKQLKTCSQPPNRTDVSSVCSNIGADQFSTLATLKETVRLNPANVQAWCTLGALYMEAGDYRQSLEHSQQAHVLDPTHVDVICNIGKVHMLQVNHEAAVQWYRAAVRLRPMCPVISNMLATALVSHGVVIKPQDPKGAIRTFREALLFNPAYAHAYYSLGVSYAEKGKNDKALMNYNLAIHFNPSCAEAHNNMGVIFKEQGQVDRALACFQLAVKCNPSFVQALNNIGTTCSAVGKLDEAFEHLKRAVAAAPNYADAFNNLGWLYWDGGMIGEALGAYERCIELAPAQAKKASQNRLLALNYVADVDVNLVYTAHCAWAERLCREVGDPFTEWPVARTTNRRLRVAYMSADFFQHSVSYFAQCLFEHRDAERFDMFVYSNNKYEDAKTALLKSMVPPDAWQNIFMKPADEVAAMIRRDCIDILVDLAGHTANNRLDVMALKPAPVQITYIGYNNTTGLGAIDYRITDDVADPVDTLQPFSEELIRVPGCFLSYTPPSSELIPDVGPLPAARDGYITFGSFSCLAKVTPQVIALWARVLHAVPNSRLLLKAKGFYSTTMKASYMQQFEDLGISQTRLRFVSLTNGTYEHLNTYNEVDIALDTFPYSNTTTTCETVLMGVPVITLSGQTHGSRTSSMLLETIGHPELVATTFDDYVLKATVLATNLGSLSGMRQQLRGNMHASELCDGASFMRRKFEPALLEKWRLFCEGRPPSQQTYQTDAADPLAPGHFAPLVPQRPSRSSGSSSSCRSRSYATTSQTVAAPLARSRSPAFQVPVHVVPVPVRPSSPLVPGHHVQTVVTQPTAAQVWNLLP